jgi:GNAT superfamily N-acetyltransferase
MPATCRPATRDDVASLARLLEAYMEETYHGTWAGRPARLEQDGFGRHFEMVVAESDGRLSAFVAWRRTYDLHHCLPGIEVIDMFVEPAVRGRGIAVRMLALAAAEGARAGATFMTGGAVDSSSVRRLYGRAAANHGGQYYLSGRAFRALVQASGVPLRELVRRLPPREWNVEP